MDVLRFFVFGPRPSDLAPICSCTPLRASNVSSYEQNAFEYGGVETLELSGICIPLRPIRVKTGLVAVALLHAGIIAPAPNAVDSRQRMLVLSGHNTAREACNVALYGI
jgi:hypothetical protein